MPKLSDRSSAQELAGRYLQLIDQGLPEQTYQAFLEDNTQLIPREFIQNHGMHFDLVLRKLAFGADYVSDFFYMSKSSDDWNLVFVEIEKPSSRFFRDNSNDLHPDFQAALQQIGRWRAWLENAANLASFVSNTVGPIHLPEVMRRNPTYPKFVLVHGRRSEYGNNVLRRGIVRAQERADFKIVSFDSLAEGLHHKHECYVGVRHNERIHLRGNRVITPEIFGWIEPSQFSVSKDFLKVIRAGQQHGPWIRRFDGDRLVDAFAYVADHILVRSD